MIYKKNKSGKVAMAVSIFNDIVAKEKKLDKLEDKLQEWINELDKKEFEEYAKATSEIKCKHCGSLL